MHLCDGKDVTGRTPSEYVAILDAHLDSLADKAREEGGKLSEALAADIRDTFAAFRYWRAVQERVMRGDISPSDSERARLAAWRRAANREVTA